MNWIFISDIKETEGIPMGMESELADNTNSFVVRLSYSYNKNIHGNIFAVLLD